MLKIILSETIVPAMVISTNMSDDDAPAWNSGTTYAAGARVVYGGAVYESAEDANLNNQPDTSAKWLFVYVANATRAFDSRLTAPVSNAGTIEYLIEPTTLVRAVGLVGVSAATATVRVRNPGGDILAEETKSLIDYSELIDALTMVLVQPGQSDLVVFEGAICAPGNRIEVVIGDGAGTPQVSEIVIGDVLSVGTAVFGVEDGIQDFSDFIEDDWGNVDIVEKGYRDVTQFPIKVQTGSRRRIKRRLTPYRAKMIMAYTDPDNEDGLNIYGRYERLDTVIDGPILSDMNLRFLGATYGS